MTVRFFTFSLVLILLTSNMFAQNHEDHDENILDAPENWLKERIPFPLSFATSIEYSGFEDLRFAPSWSKEESDEFWTYAFVWYLDNDPKLDEKLLKEHIESYYDGLMRIEGRNKDLTYGADKLEYTSVLLSKDSDGNEGSQYHGQVHTFDGFHTKKPIIFNTKIETSICKKTNKHLVMFYISPSPIDSPVWKNLETVNLNIDCLE